MAQAIYAVASYVVSAFTASAAGTATFWQAATVLAVQTAASVGLNIAANALMGGRDLSGLDRGREIATRGGSEPHQIVYGRAKVAGHTADEMGWPESGSGKNDRYFRVQVLAGHKCDAIEKIYFDGEEISFVEETGYVTGDNYFGNVILLRNVAEIIGEIGARWSGTRLGQGREWLGYLYKVNSEVGPPEMSAVVRGKRVYDPRLDDTNGGTGAQRADDPDTWAWSDNPALIAADHYRSEYGIMQNYAARFTGRVLPASWVNWSSVILAANICDETADGEKRYLCWGRFWSNEDPHDVFSRILQSMAGRSSVTGGVLTLYAGAYYAPDVTLEAVNLVGAVQVRHIRPRAEAYDGVKGSYVSEDHEFRSTSYPSVVREGFSGEPVWLPMDFYFVPSAYQCQRLANIALNRLIYARRVSSNIDFNAMRFSAGSTIEINLPQKRIENLAFEVESWEVSLPGGAPEFYMDARETHPDVYAARTPSSPSAAPVIGVSNNALIAPGDPEVSSVESLAGAGYLLTMARPPASEYVAAFELWEATSALADTGDSTVEAGAVLVETFGGTAFARTGLAVGDQRWLYVRALGANGIASGFVTADPVTVEGISPDALAEINDAVHGERGGGDLHAAATTSAAGFMAAADKTKLNGIQSEATKNQSDAYLLNRANHTGTQSADTLTDGSSQVAMTAAERAKLAGIEEGADQNPTNAETLAAVKAALGDLSTLGSGDPGAAPASYSQAYEQALRDRLEALIAALD